MATTISVFPAQARAPGQYLSGTTNYAGGFVQCYFTLVDPNWLNESTSLQITLDGQESYDNGTTWREVFGPYSWSPPAMGKNGHLPGCGFTAGNDGGGPRLVRAILTVAGVSWSGGVDLTLG